MSNGILLGNGTIVTSWIKPAVVRQGAVVWQNERIVAVGKESELRTAFPEADVLDARGGLIVPGFVNLHHHFYSALARGLDPRTSMKNFGEVLDRLWWRLDRALDAEAVRISAALSLADCIRCGCTTVFDHHASPSTIRDSLDLIADEVRGAGLSAALCYEVTDRNGHDQALEGLEENIRFMSAVGADPRVRGVLGLHASFTLRNSTLERAAELHAEGIGCHVHVAEDPIDVERTLQNFDVGPVQRLEQFDLLDAYALLAHGIHLTAQGYETIAAYNATILHNPESNANNGVGRLDVIAAAEHGCTVGLGTDGMSSSVLRALRMAFLMHRDATNDPSAGFKVIPELLGNNVRVARRFFSEPLLGDLTPAAPADIAVIDVDPPTPVESSNVFGHLVYGGADAAVRHTIARGRLLLEDFRHTTVDVSQLAERARRVAPELWGRFHGLSWGTSFLGL